MGKTNVLHVNTTKNVELYFDPPIHVPHKPHDVSDYIDENTVKARWTRLDKVLMSIICILLFIIGLNHLPSIALLRGTQLLLDSRSMIIDDSSSSRVSISAESIRQLIQVLHQQNETIHKLERTIIVKTENEEVLLQEVKDLEKRHVESSELKNGNKLDDSSSAGYTGMPFKNPYLAFEESNTVSSINYQSLRSDSEATCDLLYGMDLLADWKKNREVWCADDSASANTHPDTASELVCYPYHQAHKKKDGRNPDLICEAKNFVVDFSKIQGEHSSLKPILGMQYLSFSENSLLSTCKKTELYNDRLFMPHHARQMASFKSNATLPKDYQVVETPTYLLARDEDAENAYHSTADFVSSLHFSLTLGLPRRI
jgi:hypothetical protein